MAWRQHGRTLCPGSRLPTISWMLAQPAPPLSPGRRGCHWMASAAALGDRHTHRLGGWSGGRRGGRRGRGSWGGLGLVVGHFFPTLLRDCHATRDAAVSCACVHVRVRAWRLTQEALMIHVAAAHQLRDARLLLAIVQRTASHTPFASAAQVLRPSWRQRTCLITRPPVANQRAS